MVMGVRARFELIRGELREAEADAEQLFSVAPLVGPVAPRLGDGNASLRALGAGTRPIVPWRFSKRRV